MKYVYGLVLSVILFGSSSAYAQPELSLIPWPRELQVAEGHLALTEHSRIVYSTDKLQPLAQVLQQEIYQITGLRLMPTDGPAGRGDILLTFDPSLPGETHTVEVRDRVELSGSNYPNTALASAALLLVLASEGSGVILPRMTMRDWPHSSYRSLMIDVARQPHTIDTLKQCVVLCRLYKISTLQLHLNDDQSFAFESKAFPKLATPGHHFTRKQLLELVAFADARGVTLIPELDAPGHTTAMRRAMPELFGPPNLSVIHIGKEEVLVAMETIIEELCTIFHSSPYFHIGADEAYFANLARDELAQNAMQGKGYSDVHDLFYNYIYGWNYVPLGKPLAGGTLLCAHPTPALSQRPYHRRHDVFVGVSR